MISDDGAKFTKTSQGKLETLHTYKIMHVRVHKYRMIGTTKCNITPMKMKTKVCSKLIFGTKFPRALSNTIGYI